MILKALPKILAFTKKIQVTVNCQMGTKCVYIFQSIYVIALLSTLATSSMVL